MVASRREIPGCKFVEFSNRQTKPFVAHSFQEAKEMALDYIDWSGWSGVTVVQVWDTIEVVEDI